MADGNLNQHTFGFFEDDSSNPDACTQIGSDNSTSENWDADTNLMVRIGLDEDASKAASTRFQLYYQVNSTAGTWRLCMDTSLYGVRLASGLPTHGVALTSQLLDSGASGSWTNGEYAERYGMPELLVFGKDDYSEIQFCVSLDGSILSDQDVVYFRVQHESGDTVTFTYSVYPQITVNAATQATYRQKSFAWGDPGTESGHAIGTLNEDASEYSDSANVKKFLRFEVEQYEAAAAGGLTATFDLWYRLNGGSWVSVPTSESTNPVWIAADGDLTNGADTTNRLSGSAYSFLSNNNAVCDTSSETAAMTFSGSPLEQAEILFSLGFNYDELSDGDYLEFLLLRSSTPLDDYTVSVARLDWTAPQPTFNQKAFAWGDDDDVEASHTIGTINQDLTSNTEETKVLRFEIEQTNALALGGLSKQFKVEYRVQPDGEAWGAWSDVPKDATAAQHTEEDESGPYGDLLDGTALEIGQSFQLSSTQNVSSVKVKLAKVGSPTDDLEVGIRADNFGEPDSDWLGSDTIAGSALTTSPTEYTFEFTPVELTADTTYWVVLEKSGAPSSTNYYAYRREASGSYSDGALYQNDQGIWNAVGSSDAWFQILGSGGIEVAATANWAHGDDSTNRLSSSAYTFLSNNNMCMDDATPSTSATFASGATGHAELVVPLELGGFTADDTVEFRVVLSDGTPLGSYDQTPSLTWSSGGDTYTGDGAGTLAAVTGAGTGSYIAPVTGDGAGTLAPATGAATGTLSAPAYGSGAGAGTLVPITCSAAGTYAVPEWNGDGAGTLAAITGQAAATYSVPEWNGAGAATLAPMVGAGAGTLAGPAYHADGAGALPAIAGAAAGTWADPLYTDGAGVGTLGAITGQAGGTYTGPAYTGAGAGTLGAIYGSAAGSMAYPGGDGAGSLPAVSGAGAGTYSEPAYTGAGVGTLPAITCTAAGTWESGADVGDGAGTLAAITGTGAGTYTAPAYTGAGSGSLAPITCAAAGTFTAAAYHGDGAGALVAPEQAAGAGTFGYPGAAGAGTLAPLSGAGAGTYAGPAYSGAGAGTLAAATGAADGTYTAPAYQGAGSGQLAPLASAATGSSGGPAYGGIGSGSLAPITCAATGRYVGPTALVHARWRNDNEDEALATWAQAEDATHTVAAGGTARLRASVRAHPTGQYQWEVAKVGTENWAKVEEEA